MGWLADIRAETAAALAVVAPTHTEIPELLDLPCIILTEGEPFIEPDTFHNFTLTWQARYVCRPADNEVMVAAADQAATEVLAVDADWSVSIGAYETRLLADGQPVYTVPITITT